MEFYGENKKTILRMNTKNTDWLTKLIKYIQKHCEIFRFREKAENLWSFAHAWKQLIIIMKSLADNSFALVPWIEIDLKMGMGMVVMAAAVVLARILLFRKIVHPNILQSIRAATHCFQPRYHQNYGYEKWHFTILDAG